MPITAPTQGFRKFQIQREAFDDENVTIEFPNKSTYLFIELDELKLWMRNVGVHHLMIDKTLDLVWNFRKIDYDLDQQRATIAI